MHNIPIKMQLKMLKQQLNIPKILYAALTIIIKESFLEHTHPYWKKTRP
jgi:hypothetical protein